MCQQKICPKCKRPFPPQFYVTGSVRPRMVNIIANRPDGVTRHELMSLLYADDPNGGPEWDNVISVLINKANKQLAPQGYRISPAWKGHGARYRLEKIDESA